MSIFILKLILAPIIIGSASLAGRKWGASVSGWMVGLPLTSGPVVFFLALSHNRAFVFESIQGVLSGLFSIVAFTLAYAWTAKKFNWLISFILSMFAFFIVAILFQNIQLPFITIFIYNIITILASVFLIPKSENIKSTATPGKWDIPSRIIIGTSFIIFITAIAPYIGARLTGLLTMIPLYVSILTIFAHRHDGGDSAINVLRGLTYGLFAFASFYLALGLSIQDFSLASAFSLAILAALCTQGITLLILNMKH
ncbi:MAG: hypothetical protein KF758_05790 [Anaerolineales bacterium]|nr:hypothetical protein [Anaerolineales bacterium]